MSKIRIEHLSKIYPNGVEAVKNFNLEIDDEDFIVLVGPSGCGKSTILRMIAGLEEITAGSIYIDDKYVNDLDPKDRNLAMVFQNYALYPHLSVRKNIAFPLVINRRALSKEKGFKTAKERNEYINNVVEETAKKINLYEYLDRKPANLSGGQRQRVALGRAIVRNPKAFLLDEPLSNLDAKMRVQMRTEISRLHNELKTIFIYVTHDQVEAMTMGSKIVVLKDGVTQQISSPEELFMNPVNQFVAGFIGTPQMNFMDAKVIKKDNDLYVTIDDKLEYILPKERVSSFNNDYLGKIVTMGIRPKSISVKGDLDYKEENLTGEINLFEQLGEDTIIYAKFNNLNDDLVISTTGLGRFRKDEKIGISLSFKNVCFFDKETGDSIL